MPEDHRRVEPRSIVGTGMTADPEAIEELKEEWDTRERASRPKPKKPFKKILDAKKEQNPPKK